MISRRIEPGRLDVPARDAQPRPDIGRKATVGETRLVGEKVGNPDEAEAPAQAAAAPEQGDQQVSSLQALRANFTTPSVSDPSIFSNARAIPLLERLLTSILPQLSESTEFHKLAQAVVGEEIEQRRQLGARRAGEAAT